MRGPTLAGRDLDTDDLIELSAVHNVPLRTTQAPLGALSPFTQFASITLPSELSIHYATVSVAFTGHAHDLR